MNNLETICTQVAVIRRRYEQQSKQSGGDWNVFYAIGKTLYKSELLHSYFLSKIFAYQNEQKENVFLRLFLEIVLKNGQTTVDFSSFYTGSVNICTEKFIGHITDTYAQGGRVDILLEKAGEQIVIENKIYASDQPQQLARYHEKYPTATLIYLTLHGKNPSASSIGNLQKDEYICLSYRTDILDWLEQCRQYIQGRPECLFLYTAMEQYAGILRDLTGQGRWPQMTQEIVEILTQNKENLLSARDVAQSFTAVRNHILIEKFLTPLSKFLTEQYGPDVQLLTRQRDGIIVEFDVCMSSWKRVMLRFNDELNGICGIGFKTKQDVIQDAGAMARFIDEHFKKDRQTAWWPLIYQIDPAYPFWDFETVANLLEQTSEILSYYQGVISDLWALTKQMEESGIKL